MSKKEVKLARKYNELKKEKICKEITRNQNDILMKNRYIIIGVILIGFTCHYFSATYNEVHNELIIFAKQTEIIEKNYVQFECSRVYAEELQQFSGCIPNSCGRVVSDSVVSPQEIEKLLALAKRGLQFGGSNGGVSILDLHSGALSKGNAFVNLYKLNIDTKVFQKGDFELYSLVKRKIQLMIANHFNIAVNSLYLTRPTFFSRITNASAKTIHDQYWHPHVDKETYESFHFTSLLYLNNYNVDFEGGRFVFLDENGNFTVEPRAGRVSAFTSGPENLHHVEKVERGTRFAITIAFTCHHIHAIKDPRLEL